MKIRKKSWKKNMFAAASPLYNGLLNIYVTQNDKLSIAQKKKIKVLSWTENSTPNLYLDEDDDDLPPMPLLEANDQEKVKSELEETITERVKQEQD